MTEEGNMSPADIMIWLITMIAARRLQKMTATRVMVAVEATYYDPYDPDMMSLRR